jgi:hypothetical protein
VILFRVIATLAGLFSMVAVVLMARTPRLLQPMNRRVLNWIAGAS